MKIAFHFDGEHSSLGGFYGWKIEKIFFELLLRSRNLSLSSKIFEGDLLLESMAYESDGQDNNCRSFNPDKYRDIIRNWIRPKHTVWSSLIYARINSTLEESGCIFVVGFETLEESMAEYVDEQLLKESEAYLGALEVDDGSELHWQLYSNRMAMRYRIRDRDISIFWDGVNEDSKNDGYQEDFKKLGFKNVKFESLNGRYTIFDEYNNFEQSRRVAEWKKLCGNYLAFITDDIAHGLGDAAPELGNKLWSMLKTFNEAETNEQYAQVTASCRRTIEYISDQLFPPIDGEVEGRKVGKNQYRNRLLAFADNERRSDTNIDLICISTEALKDQLEKLSDLANKGVHAEVYRTETRRCLLRTIMLLDDIVSLKVGSFEIKSKLDFGDFFNQIF